MEQQGSACLNCHDDNPNGTCDLSRTDARFTRCRVTIKGEFEEIFREIE